LPDLLAAIVFQPVEEKAIVQSPLCGFAASDLDNAFIVNRNCTSGEHTVYKV
jgi:hypothetical protein